MPNGNIAPVNVLPPDDGSIDLGLADLDARLQAWLSAFKRALSSLPGVSPASGDAAALSEAITQESKDRSQRSRAREHASNETTAIRVNALTEAVGPAAHQEPPATVIDADEALLAALDPEARKQVRIRRRMSNNRRSIRELIEEVRSARAASEETRSNTKRKWW